MRSDGARLWIPNHGSQKSVVRRINGSSLPYAVTKVTTEWLGKVYSARYGLDVVSLRLAQVYGPGNRMPEVLGDVLKALTQTGTIELLLN